MLTQLINGLATSSVLSALNVLNCSVAIGDAALDQKKNISFM